MPKIDLAQASRSLAPDHDTATDRPQSALLVELIEPIDAAIARGVPRAVILDRLHQAGFTMSLPTFIKALQRIRRRLGRPAPRRRTVRPTDLPETPTTPQPATGAAAVAAPVPPPPSPVADPNRTIKTREQLQREHPTLSSIQISKLVAQQYADPVLTGEQLDELKRKYNPPQVRR